MPQSPAEGELEAALIVTGAVLSALPALFRLFLGVRQGLLLLLLLSYRKQLHGLVE